jgi:type I restriction enzyme S subunit
VDARYLYRWFSSDPVQAKLRSFGRKTTNISNLDMGRSLDLKLLLPSLVEQRRIAAILDQADALRAKRRAALAQLDEMARAIFVEKFGDLAPQSCKWPRQAFEQIVTDARIGLVRSSSDIGPEHPHRYLKMDAIGTNGDLDLARATRTFAGAEEVRAYSLAPGDFLFNTRNSRELVGKSAIFRSRVPHLFNNNIMRIRFCKDVAADYVLAAARTPALQREIETKKSGTTSVFAIYWKDLKTLQVPIPPKTLQADFVERMEALRASAEIQKRQGAELDGLFTSLQHRAFRGEL